MDGDEGTSALPTRRRCLASSPPRSASPRTRQHDSTMGSTSEPAATLAASLILSAVAYKLTASLVPLLGPDLVAKGLGGVDMLKTGFKRDEDLVPGETRAAGRGLVL